MFAFSCCMVFSTQHDSWLRGRGDTVDEKIRWAHALCPGVFRDEGPHSSSENPPNSFWNVTCHAEPGTWLLGSIPILVGLWASPIPPHRLQQSNTVCKQLKLPNSLQRHPCPSQEPEAEAHKMPLTATWHTQLLLKMSADVGMGWRSCPSLLSSHPCDVKTGVETQALISQSNLNQL